MNDDECVWCGEPLHLCDCFDSYDDTYDGGEDEDDDYEAYEDE